MFLLIAGKFKINFEYMRDSTYRIDFEIVLLPIKLFIAPSPGVILISLLQ